MAKLNTQSTTALNKLAEQSRSVRSRYEPQWYLNIAFYLGDQWVFWNRGRIDKPVIPKHRILLTDNRIMPVVLTRLAKKTKTRPIWTCVPNSPSDSDVDGAELATTVIESKWKELCMEQKLFSALMWADICCAGFWKITWDSTYGDKVSIVVGPDGAPLQGQDGRLMRAEQMPPAVLQQGNLQTKTVYEGDVCLEVRSPFQILQDPLADTLEECEWLIEEVVQSEEYVLRHFGVNMTGDTEIASGPAESAFFPSWQMGGSSNYKGVKVRELWMKPNSQFENGRRVVWARDKVLVDEDNTYKSLPYVMFQGAPIPGRFWPTSIVEQLREPQIELNKIKSQIRENAQRIGNPALLKDRFSNVSYSGVPGEEVFFDGTNPIGVPSYLQPPNMPPYVIEEIDRIEASIQEISGQHEVSNSQVPAGVTAASAINLLLEQDDTRLGPTISEMETQLSYAGRMVLELVAEYYTEERMLKIAGPDANYDFVSFKGEMLHGNTAVEVQAGSAFPTSKAAKQAAIRDLLTLMLQNGQTPDPRTMRRIMRDFQIGGLEAFTEDISRDVGQCNREHWLMYRGQPLPINSFDNDTIHIGEHEDQMKSNKFFRSDPRIQALFYAHVNLHKQRLEAQQQAQAEAMQQQMDIATAHQAEIQSQYEGLQKNQDFRQQLALQQQQNQGNNNG